MAGTIPTFDTRFNLPVEAFIAQALKERFPDLDIRPGSALYQAFAKPGAFIHQPFSDMLNVLRRNQSLRYFQYALPEELDRLVANYLIERKGALNANGTVRVYFNQAAAQVVGLEARFSTNDAITFQPAQTVSISAADILLNFENGLYYVDVAVVAIAAGEDGVIDAGQITQVTGVTNAVSATNKAAFFGGRDEESNAALVIRTQRSIATRTITSVYAIQAILDEVFGEALISLAVVGYGDDEMLRDRAKSVVSFDEVFTVAYARKLNVSIAADGTVWSSAGAPPSTNRYLAAIADTQNSYSEPDSTKINNPYFFFRLPIVRNGQTVYTAVQRGDVIRVTKVDQSAGPDPDDGDYTVVDIVYATPYLGHATGGGDPEKTMLLVLDRPFSNPQSTGIVITPGSADLTEYKYEIVSGVNSDEFKVGGAVDVYVHTANSFNDELIISQLFATAHSPEFLEVPVSDQVVLNPINQPYYEDGKVFQLPVISFVRVEQIDPTNASLVLRELEQGKDFIYISTSPELRLTPQETGTLRFIGSSLLGARIRIVYETNVDIGGIQEYLGGSDRRDVTKSILVKAARAALVDVQLSYSGEAAQSDVEDIIKSYIRSRPQGGVITVNEIVSVLSVFNVQNVQFPVTLTLRRVNDDGSVEDEQSQDRLAAEKLERFTPRDSLQITQA